MADRYYGRLKQMERDSKNEMSILSSTRTSLDQLTEAMMGEQISMNDYLMLLRLTGISYEKQRMPVAATRYVAMRMQSVIQTRSHKWKRQQYPLLTDLDERPVDEVAAYMALQHPWWKETTERFQRVLLAADLVVFLLVLLILVYGLRMAFLASFLISVLLWAGLAVYSQFFLSEDLAQEAMAHDSRKIGDSLQMFEERFVQAGLPRRHRGHKVKN